MRILGIIFLMWFRVKPLSGTQVASKLFFFLFSYNTTFVASARFYLRFPNYLPGHSPYFPPSLPSLLFQERIPVEVYIFRAGVAPLLLINPGLKVHFSTFSFLSLFLPFPFLSFQLPSLLTPCLSFVRSSAPFSFGVRPFPCFLFFP